MLLLYTRLFGLPKTNSESKNRFTKVTSSPSEQELEQNSSNTLRHARLTDSIRKVRQDYHLKRRFLL